jgi:transposase-like protein
MQKKKEAFPASQTGWDYEALKKKTLEQFRSDKDLFSKGGAFAPLLKDFLEAALQAELEEHLEQEIEDQNNRKNGYSTKLLKTGAGTIELDTPGIETVIFRRRSLRKEKLSWLIV